MSAYYGDEHKLIGRASGEVGYGPPPALPRKWNAPGQGGWAGEDGAAYEHEAYGEDSRRRARAKKSPPAAAAKRLPFVTWALVAVCSAVFIAELIYAKVKAGAAFQTDPINPMLGPNAYVLIQMGSKYAPCMRASNATEYSFDCIDGSSGCTLEQVCGHNLGAGWQWWRLITAMYLHAGFVHIILNMVLLYMLGGQLERALGHLIFILIYMVSGIGGFILSVNYAGQNTSSVGASGACFGLIAIELLDLLFNWKLYKRPWVNFLIHILEIIVSFVLGLLPGLDNFAHIGGFATGLLSGILLMHSPLKLRIKSHANPRKKFDLVKFDFREPLKVFENRSPAWWGWGCVRIAALILLVLYYLLLIRSFEAGSASCSWCRYLSCLPVNGWCDASYQAL